MQWKAGAAVLVTRLDEWSKIASLCELGRSVVPAAPSLTLDSNTSLVSVPSGPGMK